MAVSYKGLTIKFGGDTTGLQSALKKVQSETRKTNSDLREINKSLKFNPGNTTLLEQRVHALNKAYEETKTKLDAYKQALQQLEDKKARGGQLTEEEQRQYDSLQRSILQCENQLESYTKQLGAANTEFEASKTRLYQWGQTLEDNSERFKRVGDRMQSIGDAATKYVTAPLVGVGIAAGKAAFDVDEALTGVRKTVDATEGEYKQLRDAAIAYSETHPITATDILAAEELAGQLGVGKENLQAFAEVATGLDLATNMNVDQAATNLARFANVTNMSKLEGEDAERAYRSYGNVVVGLGNNLATTESEVSEFSLRMASAGTQAGMSEADILGIAGAMNSVGLEAQAGGSAFSKTITDIGIAVATGSDDLEKYASVAGMSAEEFATYWQEDATSAFVNFINGLANGGEDMNVILENLGITELRQSDALRRLAGNTDLLKDSVRLANDEWSNGTALADEVTAKGDSVGGKLQTLRNRVEGVLEKIGEPLLDALTSAIDAAEPFLEKIGEMAQGFADMEPEQQQFILGLAGAVAAFGPVMSGLGGLVGNLGSVGTAMKDAATLFAGFSGKFAGLGATVAKAGGLLPAISGAFGSLGTTIAGVATGPVGIAVAAIAGLVAVFKTLWDTNEGFREAVTKIWDGLMAKFNEAGARIGKAFSSIGESVSAIGGFVGEFASTLGGYFGGLLSQLGEAWKFLCDVLAPGIQHMVDQAATTIGGVVDIVSGVIETIAGLFEGFRTGDWSMLCDGLKTTWDGVWSVMTAPAQAVFDTVKDLLSPFADAWDGFCSDVQTDWENFTGVLQREWDSLSQAASNAFTAIRDEVSGDLTDAKTVGTEATNLLGNALAGKWGDAANNAQRIFQTIDDSITRHLQAAKDSGIPIVSSLASVTLDKWNALKDGAERIFSGIRDSIRDKINAARDFVRDAIDRIKDAFNFEFHWPHIPLPHIAWHWEDVGGILSLPAFDGINWYAKGGVIEPNDPRLIGVGDSHEREWIEPESKLLALIENAMRNVSGGGSTVSVEVSVNANITGRQSAYEVGQDIGRGIGSIMKQRGHSYA